MGQFLSRQTLLWLPKGFVFSFSARRSHDSVRSARRASSFSGFSAPREKLVLRWVKQFSMFEQDGDVTSASGDKSLVDKQYTYTYSCGWKYSWSHKSWRYHTVRSNLTRYHHVFLAWVLSSLLIGNRSDGSQLFRCLDTCCVFCSSLAFQFGR